jgi:TIGR03009 family protein
MGPAPLGTLVRLIRGLAESTPDRDVSDSHLLQLYARRRDNDAFAALVHRHGRLVWSACRRVLRHDADAEDAFQATFLALARHARTIRAGEAIAGWLYRVARRVAVRASRDRDRRLTRQHTDMRPVQASPEDRLSCSELRALIDDELRHLPQKYQAPFLLCCLEGKTKVEAARQLGWKEGTVSGRLAEARRRLRWRLLRRGVTPAAALAATMVGNALEAAPGPLLTSTLRLVAEVSPIAVPARVALLSQGVASMSLSKGKLVSVVLVLGGLVAGGTSLMRQPAVAARPPADNVALAAPAPPEAPPDETRAPEPPPIPAADHRLDVILRRWHEALCKVEAATCELTRTDVDDTFNKTEVWRGSFKYLKPDYWSMEMHKKDTPAAFEKFVSRSLDLYVYVPSHKRIERFGLPVVPHVRHSLESQGPLCFGMPPAEAKKKFTWKLVKEDNSYIYLEVTPRTNKDEAGFQTARVTLHKDSFLPRQVWIRSGTETTWDIARVDTSVNLTRDDFEVVVPEGWRLHSVPTPPKKAEPEPPPPEPPVRSEPAERLDDVLRRMKHAVDQVESLSCELTRTYRHHAAETVTTVEGHFKFQKPNRAVLELRDKNAAAAIAEKNVCDGKRLYSYDSQKKVIRAIDDLSLLKKLPDHTLGAVALGMTLEDARRRYQVKVTKEDQWYLYLEMRPYAVGPPADFVQARLVLSKDTMLPRQFWSRLRNDDEVTWDVVRLRTGVELKPEEFEPTLPQGWRMDLRPSPDEVRMR